MPRRVYSVSLYPTVQFFDSIPVGEPVITVEPDSLEVTEAGLYLVDVDPPPRLHVAVLPYRNRDGRLLFGLCGGMTYYCM